MTRESSKVLNRREAPSQVLRDPLWSSSKVSKSPLWLQMRAGSVASPSLQIDFPIPDVVLTCTLPDSKRVSIE